MFMPVHLWNKHSNVSIYKTIIFPGLQIISVITSSVFESITAYAELVLKTTK